MEHFSSWLMRLMLIYWVKSQVAEIIVGDTEKIFLEIRAENCICQFVVPRVRNETLIRKVAKTPLKIWKSSYTLFRKNVNKRI
jgi:hypothetical protein